MRDAIDMAQCTVEDCGYEVVGILDKYYYGNTDQFRGIPIIGSEDQLLDPNDSQAQEWRGYDFLLTSWWTGAQYIGRGGLDDEAVRLERAKLLTDAGLSCPTIVHPSVVFRGRRESVNIDTGSIILPDVTFGPRNSIGKFSFVDWGASMYTEVHVKNNVIIGAEASLDHATIEDNVRIGAGSMVVPIGLRNVGQLTVGRNSTVWMGCHAYKNIPEDSMWTKGDKIISKTLKKDTNEN